RTRHRSSLCRARARGDRVPEDPVKIALAHPELAPLLLAAVLIVALCAVALVRRRRALAAFAGTGARLASASPARQVTKLILVGAGCLLVVVALVGPEIGEAPRRAPISTLDTIVALDISQSMAVRDVETDRLHVAQRAIELLGQQLSGGRVGLTLFGGSSVLRYPLTASTKIVGPALDTSGHGFHVQPGSSLQAALDGAAAQFPTTAADDLRTRAIVVVSDGEDPVPDLPVLDPYLALGIHVFTLGIGTPAGGPVPVYDIKGQYQQMLVDANGTQITSRLDEARLVNLATAGGGRYFRYENEGTVKTLSDALRATDMAVATTEGGLSAEDRYQIFLGVGLVLLIADWLLGERRPMPRPRLPRGRTAPSRPRNRERAAPSRGCLRAGRPDRGPARCREPGLPARSRRSGRPLPRSPSQTSDRTRNFDQPRQRAGRTRRTRPGPCRVRPRDRCRDGEDPGDRVLRSRDLALP